MSVTRLRTRIIPADFQVNPNFPEGNYLKVLFIEIEKYFYSKVPAPLIGIGTFAWCLFYSNFWAFGCLQNAASRSSLISLGRLFQNTGGYLV